MLLETLQKNFATKSEAKKTNASPEGDRCDKCGGSDQWQPVGSDRWLCAACKPPPSVAFVGSRRGPQIDAEQLSPLGTHEPVIVCHTASVCSACHGSWIVEAFGLDGGSMCYSCRQPVTQEEIFEAIAIQKIKNSFSHEAATSATQNDK